MLKTTYYGDVIRFDLARSLGHFTRQRLILSYLGKNEEPLRSSGRLESTGQKH